MNYLSGLYPSLCLKPVSYTHLDVYKRQVSSNTNEIKSLKSKIDELQAQLQELLNDDDED